MKKTMTTIMKRLSAIIATFIIVVTLAAIPSMEAQAANASNGIAWGIDVSKHNGPINWDAVAASGVKFVFIKAGSTNSGMDPYFQANMAGANAAGLKVGVYVYSYASTSEQALNEANLVLSWIEPYTVSFPVVYDIENVAQARLGQAQIQDLINTFCGTVAAQGYYPMVYSSKSWFSGRLAGTSFDKWVAQYNDHLDYEGAAFWQNSCSARVSGISTAVDTNYQFKDYSQIIIPDGLVDRDGGTRFYANYKMQRGWVDWAETRFHIDDAGYVQKSMWYSDESGIYYLQGDGSVARGQVNVEGGDFYFDGAGHRLTGWLGLENGKFYYAPDTGLMVRGWFADETGTYYLNPESGAVLTGVRTIDGNNYYFNENGVRVSGWVGLETGIYYYAADTGIMVKGWLDDESGRHYMSTKDGHLLVGDVTIEKKNYYFGDDGIMKTGLVTKADGNTYYYDENGVNVVGTQIVIGDKTYDISKKGIVTEVVPEPVEEVTDPNAPATP